MKYLLFVFLLCGQITLFAQGDYVIVRQSAGTSYFYYTSNPTNADIQLVIDASVAGDTIILPGVTFVSSNNITANVPSLVIVGSGYDPTGVSVDSPTIISITSNLKHFNVDAPGIEMHGVQIMGSKTYVKTTADNFSAHRCMFDGIEFGIFNTSGPNNLLFRECIMNGVVDGNNSNNTDFYNCFIGRLDEFHNQNVFVDHCIFSDQNLGSISDNVGVLYENSIFMRVGIGGSTYDVNENSTFHNCVFLAPSFLTLNYGAGVTHNGTNVLCTNGAAIFINAQWIPGNNQFNANWDYSIAPGCAQGIGTFGSDPGLFDGGYPWKEDGLPFHPHWESLQFAPFSTSGGLLPGVLIEAEAQQN